LEALRTDYAAMEPMIFGACPEWEAITQGLTQLETVINVP
jgi:hypothetical protein